MVGDVVFQCVRDRIVEFLAQRHVAETHVVVVVGTHQVLCPRCVGTLLHGLVGKVYVEVAETLAPCVHDYGNRRVALHGQCLASEKLPLRKPSVFAVDVEHRVYHRLLPVGVDEGQQLVQVAVRVP